MKLGIKKFVALTTALLLTGHLLLFYALPFKIFGPVFLVFIILFLFIGGQNAILVSVSFAVATLIFGVMLRLSGVNAPNYFRPHEMFMRYDKDRKHRRYDENIRFEMTMPHGDLKFLGGKVAPVPRKIIFHTDSLGFRNSKDYHGQEYLLVGDSFIVGNSTTQHEIITEQLFEAYGIDTYNLAHQGDVKAYADYVRSLHKSTGTRAKVVLFLFEGNDFPSYEESTLVASDRVSIPRNPIGDGLMRYYKLFSRTDIYLFMYSSIQKIANRKTAKKKEVELVMVRNVNDIPMAFYQEYVTATEQDFMPENPETEKHLRSLKKSIAHMFFIPTKYRVYYKHINGHKPRNGQVLPDKNWEWIMTIAKKLGIPITNLTPALIEESDKLIKEGIVTYWRDDTHWNRHGIRVARDMVQKEVFSRQCH